MPNMIDFIRESAVFLAQERPDLYSVNTAMADLDRMIDQMRTDPDDTWTSFASFMLIKHVEDDDIEEWFLTRKVSSAAIYGAEEVCQVFGHTDQINLPSPLDYDEDL